MSAPVSPRPESLADLIDSRPDLREILATNFNLAHSVLLLRRGETEAVERALELAIRQGTPDALIVAECIRIEMDRQSGDSAQAIQRAEALARKERFNVMAVLYFRHLFPFMDSERAATPQTNSVVAEATTDELDSMGAADSQSIHSVAIEPEHVAAPVATDSDLPAKWQAVGTDPSVLFLRIQDGETTSEVRREEIGVGVLEDLAFGLTNRILDRLSFGAMRHCAFEATARTIHVWQRDGLKASTVVASGPSTSLVAARCTRAFEEHA